ncbi:MAG: beta-lactamase family protein [Bacteroidetes bacterium]|nr:beta-lactamase family protein [Bacteroidota bacterium]MCW5894584.1 beta-lactamase family protein [Bacteroidota bacterium]
MPFLFSGVEIGRGSWYLDVEDHDYGAVSAPWQPKAVTRVVGKHGRYGLKTEMTMRSPSTASAASLQRLVDRLASRKHIPHAVLVLETLDQSFSWSGATGKALPDGTPMTTNTPYFIASIDKIFVAAVILILHERRVLSIERSIAEYLPPGVINGLHRLNGTDYSERITIRNLLGHTSGLPDYLEDYPKRGPSLVEQLFSGEDRELTMETILRVVKEQLEPHFPPQAKDATKQRVRYSDTNFKLLAAIIEVVCNTPLPQTVAEMIFLPLKLPHTWYAGFSGPSELPSPPAMLWVGDRPLDRPRLLRSLHSIYSTPSDQVAFLRALVQGRLFQNGSTLSLMQGRWNRFGIPLDRGALRSPGWPIEYALGLKRFQLPRLFAPFSPMPSVIGHTGSTGTWLFYCHQLKVFVAGAVNQATAGAVPFRLVPEVLRIVSRDVTNEEND